MTGPMVVRWVWSSGDERSHVLDENDTRSEMVVTRCGLELSGIVTLYSIAPSMTICPHCEISAAVPPPEHVTHSEPVSPQDADRSSVERIPRPARDDRLAPRKDSTTA